MIAGCYVLHLYCRYAPQSEESLTKPDEYDRRHSHGPSEFNGETRSQANSEARRAGWRFGRDGDVTCPTCCKFGPGTKSTRELVEATGGLATLATIAERRSHAK